jgi:hypothetical protein
MAYPLIQSVDTQFGTVTVSDATWDVTYPTNLADGDLIILLIATFSNPSITPPANFIGGVQNVAGSTTRLLFAKALADGTETGNFTVTLGTARQGAWRTYRITNWYGEIGTTFDGTTSDGSVTCRFPGGSTSTSAAVNPPDMDPAGWDTEDTLFFAPFAATASPTISAYPANMPGSQSADVSGGASGATLGVATASITAASFNGDDYTISASVEWGIQPLAVRGVASDPDADFAPLIYGYGAM